jgi:hypothetical protein
MSREDWIPATPDTVPPSGWILIRETKTGKDYWVDPKTLNASAPRSELTDEQMDRIRRVALALQEHDPSPVEQWFENVRWDQLPEGEIQTWEEIVDVYLAELADRPSANAEQRHLIYSVLVSASMLTKEMCEPGTVMSMYPKAKKLPNLDRVVDRFRERRFGTCHEGES